MALAVPYPSRGTPSSDYYIEYPLGTLSTAVKSDHGDINGYISRVYIHAVNGAANSAVWTVEGSHTGGTADAEWQQIATRTSAAVGHNLTNVTSTAALQHCVFLSGPDCPRYIRVNVGTHNTNGTTFKLVAER